MGENHIIEIHRQHSTPSLAPRVRRFLLQFLELQIPMGFGALVCYIIGRLIPASSNFAATYHPGTYLYTAGDVLFLTLPVVAWMIFRRHGWRHSIAMAVAMLSPVVLIIVLGQMAGSAYLLWLITAMYPAMCLGMLVFVISNRNHFAEQERPSTPVAMPGGEV